MMTGNWAPATRERIQSVIDANADSGRYVVFDFDNTSAIFDVEEALLAYQIENLQFKIDPVKCKGCTLCARTCPAGAINGSVKNPHVIDQSKCIKCGACMEKCKFGAISKG